MHGRCLCLYLSLNRLNEAEANVIKVLYTQVLQSILFMCHIVFTDAGTGALGI